MVIDDALRVLKAYSGQAAHLASGSTGVGVFVSTSLTGVNTLFKLDPTSSTTNDWNNTTVVGMVNADPVIDVGGRAVWVSAWQEASAVGKVVIYKFDLDTGAWLNAVGGTVPPAILSLQLDPSPVNPTIMPMGAFNADGSLYYVPLLSMDGQGTVKTTVFACATQGLCDATTPARRWTSPTLTGRFDVVTPFASGSTLAVLGATEVWFLTAQQGVIANLDQKPMRASGSLQVLGYQAGVAREFYVLSGPSGGAPSEVIAVDAPEAGELWRVGFGSGTSALDGLTVGVDDSGQAWLRVGTDLAKPLSLDAYRRARGPTHTAP